MAGRGGSEGLIWPDIPGSQLFPSYTVIHKPQTVFAALIFTCDESWLSPRIPPHAKVEEGS